MGRAVSSMREHTAASGVVGHPSSPRRITGARVAEHTLGYAAESIAGNRQSMDLDELDVIIITHDSDHVSAGDGTNVEVRRQGDASHEASVAVE